MPATLDPTEVQAALGELSRLLRRLPEVRAGFDRVAAGADPSAAQEEALSLSAEVPEVRVFGALDRVTEPELHDLLAAVTPDALTRVGVAELVERMRCAPRLYRALAHVHPYSFAPVGARAWETYRAWLRGLREQPLWGIPEPYVVRLGDVYVPHRYREVERPRASGRWQSAHPEAEPDRASDPAERPIELDLLPRLLALLTDTRAESASLTCVVGGPGSGKSTLASMLASELARDDLVQPLLVRLREIRPENDLFDEVRRTLSETDSTMPEELASARRELAAVFTRAPRLVLLLDGFDELVQSSRAGLGSFFLRLEGLLREQRVHSIACFGRDTVFSRDDTAWPAGVRVFSLAPFDDAQATAWCERWARVTGRAFDWRAFAELSGDDDARALRSLAHEPLTLRLLALLEVEGVGVRDDIGRVDLARVYHKLIQETCRRHQAERGDFTAAELRRLLRVIGYAVMQSGSEVIRLDDLERTLRALGMNVDTDKTESRATALILAISQRVSERVERAWEFLHKSLGEYLAAEFLAAEIASMVAEERDEFGETRPRLDDPALCRRWIERFGPALVSPGVERFLQKMAGDWPSFVTHGAVVEPNRDLARLAERLGKTYSALLDEVEAEVSLATARVWSMRPSRVAGYALGNVFLLAGLRQLERVVFCPETHAPGRYADAYFTMRRVIADETWTRVAARTGLRGIVAGTNLSGFNLAQTSWSKVEASELNLAGADLSGVVLTNTTLTGCDMSSVKARGAFVQDVRFARCSLVGADMAPSVLRRVQFENCLLSHAVLPAAYRSHVPSNALFAARMAVIDRRMSESRYSFTIE